jgi:DNA-binding GntR family transcriptional regulator
MLMKIQKTTEFDHISDNGDVAPGAATGSVTALIRRDIVAGELALGSRLKLHALAERYGFGLMPIRGALQQLQGEGLVDVIPNCGARVRAIDGEFVANLFDLRIVIEALLARRAAERITQDQLSALARAQEGFEESIRDGDQPAILLANRTFHAIVNEAARNPEATAILARQRDLTAALWARYGYGTQRAAGAADDHRQLLSALRSHDADLAASIATAHAAKARNELLARMSAAQNQSDAA